MVWYGMIWYSHWPAYILITDRSHLITSPACDTYLSCPSKLVRDCLWKQSLAASTDPQRRISCLSYVYVVYFHQVIVNCSTAGCEQKFRCGKWLALDEGDGVIERTLYETSRKMREKSLYICFVTITSVFGHHVFCFC